MTAATITPINATTGSSLVKRFTVPAGEEWSIDVRVCASGVADATFDLLFKKSDGSSPAYRAKDFPVALGSGVFDVEKCLTLPAGWELWDRSPGSNVDVSYTGTKRLVA